MNKVGTMIITGETRRFLGLRRQSAKIKVSATSAVLKSKLIGALELAAKYRRNGELLYLKHGHLFRGSIRQYQCFIKEYRSDTRFLGLLRAVRERGKGDTVCWMKRKRVRWSNWWVGS